MRKIVFYLLVIGIVLITVFVVLQLSMRFFIPYPAKLVVKVAEEIVKDKLLAPRSAVFSNVVPYVYEENPNRFEVHGMVDSPNAFGVMIRKKFVLVIEYIHSPKDSYSQKADLNNWFVHSLVIK